MKLNPDLQLVHISGREAQPILENGGIILDVRPSYELIRLFDVNAVLYCPYNEIADRYEELQKDKILITADAVGIRSKEVAEFLVQKGYKNIYHLAGGIVDWERLGCPVTTDKSRILSGSCMCQLKVRNKT